MIAMGKNAPRAFEPILNWAQYVGMNLANLRRSKGLSQRDLAEMIGVNQSTVQRAEKMHPSAKLETYQLAADALECDLSDIFTNSRAATEVALLRKFRDIPAARQDKVFAILDLVRSGSAQLDQ